MTGDEGAAAAPGEALTLQAGRSSAVIHPGSGGRLGQLDLGGGPLLRAPAPDLGWGYWGCYPLLPWSNRIPDGHLRFGVIDDHLPVNWPDGSAIHGLAASCAWEVADASDRAADLEVEVRAGPYAVVGRQSFRLEDGRLDLSLSATNIGPAPVPMGLGIHPWFRGGPIRVPAEARWPGEPLPTGPPEAVDGSHDLRGGTSPVSMDACFTSLTDHVAEVPGANLVWAGPVTQVVVYSGEPGWVCVEPVTMANNGFELADAGVPGHGVQVIEPGDSLEVGYRFERV